MGILKKVALSLTILFGLSCILSYFFYDGYTLRSFIKWNLLFVAIQLCVHQGITYLIDLMLLQKVRKQEIELAQINASTIATLTCPCDRKQIQSVNIGLDRDNNYKCDRCSKTISAKIELSTVLKTDPLAVDKLPEILNALEEKIKIQ